MWKRVAIYGGLLAAGTLALQALLSNSRVKRALQARLSGIGVSPQASFFHQRQRKMSIPFMTSL